MKTSWTIFLGLFLTVNFATAQDTLYVYQYGAVLYKRVISAVDSVTFQKMYTPPSTVTDKDGNVYQTVTIGTQTWMASNLRVTHFRNGESITNLTVDNDWYVATYGAWCDYANLAANGTKYGHLYNWYAVADSRNIAPTGWHVPTDVEWTTLENYLIANGYNYDGTTSGNKIAKSLSATTDWNSDTGTGTIGNDLTKNNTSGFTALPGGYRYVNGTFYSGGGYWWSSTEYYTTYALVRFLNCDHNLLNRGSGAKNYGYSVRCVRN